MSETAEIGTALYQRAISRDYGRKDIADLMREVWEGTPWMVNAYTGGWGRDPDREYEIKAWCTERLGPEAWPILARPGNWHRGGATVDGWTWMGFATAAMLAEFEAAWPAPNPALSRPPTAPQERDKPSGSA